MAANIAEKMSDPDHNPEDRRLGTITGHMERKRISMRAEKNGVLGLVLEDSSITLTGHHARSRRGFRVLDDLQAMRLTKRIKLH